MPQSPDPAWDVFVAHAGPDVVPAHGLADALGAHGLRCFLDADRLRGGARWPIELKRTLARSAVIAVIVSKHSDAAFYLQEEVAIAISLHRRSPEAIRVVPVLLKGTKQSHLPYGTFSLHSVRLGNDGWPGVAEAIATILHDLPQRSPGPALANSARLLDDLWAGLEPALQGKGHGVPDDYRLRFAADGEDVVGRFRQGGEAQRVTRAQLKRRLKKEQLRHIEVLERSMEINKAIWDERYPNRVLDRRSRRAANEAAAALAEDLSGVLDAVEQAGLWLDDHYLDVRQVVGHHAPR